MSSEKPIQSDIEQKLRFRAGIADSPEEHDLLIEAADAIAELNVRLIDRTDTVMRLSAKLRANVDREIGH